MGLETILAGPLVLVLVLGGLIFNALQLILMLTLLPLSRNLYRRVNAVLSNSYWSQIIWFVEWWGRLKLRIFVEPGAWEQMGKENAIAMANHKSDVDWVVGWVLAQRGGCLGTTRALMKKILQYLPIVGWSMWFSEYSFLARDWAKDQTLMKAAFERLRDFPLPFWMAIFPEGTRFTPEKLKAAQEFAQSQGLYVPRNTLVPRTKGFQMTVEYLRDFVPAIVDITLTIPDGVDSPTFGGFLQRKRSEMDLYIRRVPMDSLPKDGEGISKWCKDCFIRKDELLEEHKKINSFDPKLFIPTQPSRWPIFHTLLWSVFTISVVSWAVSHFVGTIELNWETGLVLALIGLGSLGLVEFLFFFTKSEYSTKMKTTNKKTAKLSTGVTTDDPKPAVKAE